MTDLEMILWCAKAMDYNVRVDDEHKLVQFNNGGWQIGFFDPLHDDAQAMQLLKMFRPHIDWLRDGSVSVWSDQYVCAGKDLNRAIVECVAKMEASK